MHFISQYSGIGMEIILSDGKFGNPYSSTFHFILLKLDISTLLKYYHYRPTCTVTLNIRVIS